MARRKKYEFRPDTVRNDILGKLLLTRKQRKTLLRWTLFSLVCLVALLLQDVVMSRVSIFGATTDLVPCCILTICILQGAESGCIFALSASVFFFLSGSSPGAQCIPLITALAVFAAMFRQAYLRQGFATLMLCLSLSLLVYELATFGIGAFLGYTLPARLGSFCISCLITLATVPLSYPILKAIGKIGGEIWKE
ncbi:MAG: hypothetical protein IJW45_05310 [Oscillospiraceae bacterium]|nr:hypothetical protein [Oscillospiraceae bacterium]